MAPVNFGVREHPIPLSDSPDLVLECLRAHLDAENSHDLAAIMATYVSSPRVTINGQTFSGYEAVLKFHARFGFGGDGSFSEVNVVERVRHRFDISIVLEQSLSGVHTRRWQGHEATGRRFEIPVCTVYTFSAQGKLASEDGYFDRAQIEQQLGFANAP